MEPHWPCVDNSGTLHISKKGLTAVEVSLQSIVTYCAAYSLPSVEMFLSQFPSDLSPSSEAGCCHGHAV